MLTFAQRRQNLKRLSADVRADLQVASLAASVVGLFFGAVECGRGEIASDRIWVTKTDGDNVEHQEVLGVQWTLTENRAALAETV